MESINLNWLHRARKQLELDIEDVAKKIGKSKETLWRYENGSTSMTVDTLFKLLDIYGLSIADILVKEGSPNVFDPGALKECRKRLGLQQSDVAKKLGISTSKIHKQENGLSKVAAEDLLTYADLYHVDINEFYKCSPSQRFAVPNKKEKNTHKKGKKNNDA